MIAGTAPDSEMRYGNGRISPPVRDVSMYKSNNLDDSGVRAKKNADGLTFGRAHSIFLKADLLEVITRCHIATSLKSRQMGLATGGDPRPGCAILPLNAVAPHVAT